MSENFGEISPNSLDNLSPSYTESEPLSPRTIINQIARTLAESTQTISHSIPSNISSQPSFSSQANFEVTSQQNNANMPRNSQCIDLTKEQDDVMIIADTRRSTRRTNLSSKRCTKFFPSSYLYFLKDKLLKYPLMILVFYLFYKKIENFKKCLP